MSDRRQPIATSSQTVGPFFHFGLTSNERLGQIAPPGTPGDHIELRILVLDGEGAPVPDAIVEIYQADAKGQYPDSTRPPAPSPVSRAPAVFTGFGRLPTGADGWCVFQTITPGVVRAGDVEQARHFNVCLLSRGLLRQIYTRIYFQGDPGLAADPILGLVPAERRQTLLAHPTSDTPAMWEFVIRLQGDGETVFFDL